MLRLIARRTWRFFETFVGPEDHALPPDNFQEDPEPVVAMRTSPTNIGLQLLATTSAWDLGFITLDEMTRRIELAFRSLERMRRFNGHFYNWYELEKLTVLEPAYISTVDSGNLAGHLVALRQACIGLIDEPAFDGRVGILPRHAPFMTLLGNGPLIVRSGSDTHRFTVNGGFLQAVNNTVRVVAEHVKGA